MGSLSHAVMRLGWAREGKPLIPDLGGVAAPAGTRLSPYAVFVAAEWPSLQDLPRQLRRAEVVVPEMYHLGLDLRVVQRQCDFPGKAQDASWQPEPPPVPGRVFGHQGHRAANVLVLLRTHNARAARILSFRPLGAFHSAAERR
jgi:hypothetical protein